MLKKVLLFVLIVLALVACNESATPTAEPATSTPDESVEVAESIPPPPLVGSVDLLLSETQPVEVNAILNGSLPDECTSIQDITQTREGNTFFLTVETEIENSDDCGDPQSYKQGVELEVVDLPAGGYVVDADGVRQPFVLSAANVVPEPTATPEPTDEPAPTDEPEATDEAEPEETADPTAEPEPTTPPEPTAEPVIAGDAALIVGADSCIDLVAFDGETVPDDTEIETGTTFEKQWTLINIGNCQWTDEYQLVFVDGEQMGADDEIAFPNSVNPTGVIAITAELTAPDDEGTYRGNWKVLSPSGDLLGVGDLSEPVWVQIAAVDDPLPTPTPQPTVDPDAQAGQTIADEDVCIDVMGFEDETVPDDTVVEVGASFTKAWTLINTGNCAWTEEYELVFVDGEPMGATDGIPVEGTIDVLETFTFEAELTAPDAAGTYRGNWKLQTPSSLIGVGDSGDPVWAQIVTAEEGSLYSIEGVVWEDICRSSQYTGGNDELPIGCVNAGGDYARADGSRSSDEEPLSNVLINLGRGDCTDDVVPIIAQVRTDREGGYQFGGITATTHCVWIDFATEANVSILDLGSLSTTSFPEPGTLGQTLTPELLDQQSTFNFGWDYAD